VGDAAVACDELENEEIVAGGQRRHGNGTMPVVPTRRRRKTTTRCWLGWAGNGPLLLIAHLYCLVKNNFEIVVF